MAEISCDPVFRKELDAINTTIELEDELAYASERMEILELFDKASLHGDGYLIGYQDGLFAGRELLMKYEDARRESIRQKHNDLLKRGGLET